LNKTTFTKRRAELRAALPDGAILFFGQGQAPRNYPANAFTFRQSSHFLYYFGLSEPGLAAVIGPGGATRLFGPPVNPDDLVWHGPGPSLADHAKKAGVARSLDIAKLGGFLANLRKKGVPIHYTPPIRGDETLGLAALLKIAPSRVAQRASAPLARAIVEQRSIKSRAEVAEIERALAVTAQMHAKVAAMARPGVKEMSIAGAIEGIALAHGMAQSYLPIVTVRGEILHNESHGNTLQKGDLLLVDAAAESTRFYASDITRTTPVSGRFTTKQKEIYQVVLEAQAAAIDCASPRVSNVDIHMAAARTVTRGLIACGLMQGDPEEAIAVGAHALFFPHGIGHMLGLDVHDMEDLGRVVGYPGDRKRSKQFGLSYLRLVKKLVPGFVITVEPGIYFVPALMDLWKKEKKHAAFINYTALAGYRKFGGIRIEDDVLITGKGQRVLGPKIPKTVEEVER
jgi:Xaa-Pro aminopeptidase